MTGYELEDEFISRTEKNLRTIEKLSRQGESVYEVTQLINSLLGLLVFPREVFLDNIPRISRENMEKEGWPLPDERIGQVRHLRELVKNLRNGVAHCNIELITNGSEIDGIQFKNYDLRDKEKTNPLWIGIYRLDQLRRFVDMFLSRISKNKPLR